MRKPRRLILILLVLLGLCLPLAVPAEDVPETMYDESETLPCQATPAYSVVVSYSSVRVAIAGLSVESPLLSTKRSQCSRDINERPLRVSDSLIILNRSLRC